MVSPSSAPSHLPQVGSAKPPFYHIYQELSAVLGVRHVQIAAPLDGGCAEARKTRRRLPAHEAALRCNLTVSPTVLLPEVHLLRRHCRLPPKEPRSTGRGGE